MMVMKDDDGDEDVDEDGDDDEDDELMMIVWWKFLDLTTYNNYAQWVLLESAYQFRE